MTFLELEKACKKRRIKKLFILFIYILLLALGLSAAYKFYFLKKTPEKKHKAKHIYIKSTKKTHVSKKKLPHKKNTAKKPDSEKVKKANKKNILRKLTYVLDLNTDINESVKKSVKIKKTEKTETLKKNVQNKVELQTSVLPSYSTCIKLSEEYLEKKQYEKALKWAKNANIQNKDDPVSWILSAKALYGMKEKHKALKLLEIYYNYHRDERVKKLIGELKNEK